MLFLVNTLWYGQSLVEVKLKFVLTHSHRSLASLILSLLLWHGQSMVEVKLKFNTLASLARITDTLPSPVARAVFG